jgi:hypothetical protein
VFADVLAMLALVLGPDAAHAQTQDPHKPSKFSHQAQPPKHTLQARHVHQPHQPHEPHRHGRGHAQTAPARPRKKARALRQVCWQPDLHQEETVDFEHRTIRKGDVGNSWTAGVLLPPSGRFAWRVRIDNSLGNQGAIFIGVMDFAGTYARVFSPCTGLLHCIEHPLSDDDRVIDRRAQPVHSAIRSVVSCP